MASHETDDVDRQLLARGFQVTGISLVTHPISPGVSFTKDQGIDMVASGQVSTQPSEHDVLLDVLTEALQYLQFFVEKHGDEGTTVRTFLETVMKDGEVDTSQLIDHHHEQSQ